MKKAREHNCLLFTLFIDLKKAYDSVPRAILWQVLEKYGVPLNLLPVVRSFHEDMRASVRVWGMPVCICVILYLCSYSVHAHEL